MPWKTDISGERLLGVGIYSPKEAALYITRGGPPVRPQQVSRWIHGQRQSEPVVRAEFPGHREIISFLDMVQAMAIRDMRYCKNIPLQRIRQAVAYLRTHHPEVEYPFAHRHETFLIEETKELAVLLPQDEPEHVLQVSGHDKGQYVHATLLDKYLTRLEFNEQGQARKWIPVEDHGARIEFDPNIRFGQPRIRPSGYLVQAIAEAAETEGVKQAAWWYDIPEHQVTLALRYQQQLEGIARAAAS